MNTKNQTKPSDVLLPWLEDPDVREIMVDGFNNFYIWREGQFEDTATPFRDDEHLLEVIRYIAELNGHQLNESNPMVDMRLSDGSRCNVVIPPISLIGPILTIRKFATVPLTFDDLLNFGSIDESIIELIRAAVQGRLNIIFSGGYGSGKTTFLNLIAGMISPEERIITVENVAEIRLPPHLKRVISLESRPANLEGKGEVSIHDLVINAARMHPDRIILGEMRSSEAFTLFGLMNTGHDGCMFTMHARGVRDALTRLETMVTMADISMPLLQIRQEMATAINLIVHVEQLRDESRKVLKVSEVVGLQGDTIDVRDIFEFRQTGVKDGRIVGHFTGNGYIPSFSQQLRNFGIELPLSIFTPK